MFPNFGCVIPPVYKPSVARAMPLLIEELKDLFCVFNSERADLVVKTECH